MEDGGASQNFVFIVSGARKPFRAGKIFEETPLRHHFETRCDNGVLKRPVDGRTGKEVKHAGCLQTERKKLRHKHATPSSVGQGLDTGFLAPQSPVMSKAQKTGTAMIPAERIAGSIYLIRSQKVMLDSDLAILYGVETKALNKAVTRNLKRFPEDFMFKLTKDEFEHLRFQFGTSNDWGGRRYPPRVFTEQGVAMLSSALRSEQAVQVNIAIMRTFVRLRDMLATNEDLARKVARHDQDIGTLFAHVQRLLTPPDTHKKHPIGFVPLEDKE